MKIYKVFVSNNKLASDNFIFMAESFNFKAAIFTFVWTLYNRLWLATILMSLLTFFFCFLAKKEIISSNLHNFLDIAIMIVIGIYGNDFYSNKLVKKGYELYDIICAKSLDEARQQFFSKHLKSIG